MNESLMAHLKDSVGELKTKEDFQDYVASMFTAYTNKEITDSDLDDLVINLMTKVKGFDPRIIFDYACGNVDDYLADYFISAPPRIERKISMIRKENEEKNPEPEPTKTDTSEIPPEELEHCKAIKYLAEINNDLEYFELLARMDDETYASTVKQMLNCRMCPHLQVKKSRFSESLRRILHIRPDISRAILMARIDDKELDIKNFLLKNNLVESEKVLDRIIAEAKLVSSVDGNRGNFGLGMINFLKYEQSLIENNEITPEKAKELRDDLFNNLNIVGSLTSCLEYAPANLKDEIKTDIAYLKEHPSTMVIPFFELSEDKHPEEYETLKGLVYAYMDKHGLWEKDPTFWNRANAKRYVVFYEE